MAEKFLQLGLSRTLKAWGRWAAEFISILNFFLSAHLYKIVRIFLASIICITGPNVVGSKEEPLLVEWMGTE